MADWSSIFPLAASFAFRGKYLCDPCKNYQPPHRIFVHRWEKLCVRYPTSAKAQITMSSKNNNKLNIPEARAAMDKFKMEAANEVGVYPP